MITISLIEHKKQERIRIDCKKEQTTINKIKKIDGRRWSASKRCWHIPYQKVAYNQLQSLFGKENINITFSQNKNQESTKSQPNNPKIRILKPKLIYYKYDNKTYFSIGGEVAIVNKDRTETNCVNVYIPKNRRNWIEIVKKIVGSRWDKEQKYWKLPLYKDTIDQLNQIANIHYNFEIPKNLPDLANTPQNYKAKKSKTELNPFQIRALTTLEEKLMLERKSWRTIKGYKTHLRGLFRHYPNTLPSKITNQQIQKYLLYKIKNDKIKETTQDQFINAIVAFYKKILGQEVKLEGIKRPKKVRSLPNVFSKEEVAALLNCTDNIKHKSMLAIIYSAGLRKSEVINLRKRDILFQRNCIFVKGGKGKKDRYVLLANKAKEVIKIYLDIYHPRYWLFEGQRGGQYGDRSLQSIFTKAKELSNVNPYVTLHGLRHSFATHLIENGIPLHVIKDLLGHNSIKTTEVYLHISNKYRQKLQSPLDNIKFDINLNI